MFDLRLPAVVLTCALAACSTSYIHHFDSKTHVGLLDFTGVHELAIECPGDVDDLRIAALEAAGDLPPVVVTIAGVERR